MRLLPSRAARLRVIPGGFGYVSPVLSLDLSRNGIVLRDAKPLTPRAQLHVLQIIDKVGASLGFAPSGEDASQLLPPPGAALAVSRQVLEIDQAGRELVVRGALEEQNAAGRKDPGEVVSAHEDPDAGATADDPRLDM